MRVCGSGFEPEEFWYSVPLHGELDMARSIVESVSMAVYLPSMPEVVSTFLYCLFMALLLQSTSTSMSKLTGIVLVCRSSLMCVYYKVLRV